MDAPRLRSNYGELFFLQQQRRFLAQYWKKALGCLRQQPGQRQFDAQRVVQHIDGPRRSLTKRAQVEAQRISFPPLLLDCDHVSEVTLGFGKALLETSDSLDLSQTLADDDCDGISHGKMHARRVDAYAALMIARAGHPGPWSRPRHPRSEREASSDDTLRCES